tara:strand:+ start:9736 stop:9951 length:216 start_codon:yes stop_codon:yes gene_type:complete
MDSISKLKMILERIEDREIDKDMKVSCQWDVILGWAYDVIKLDKNIHETSLNHKHRTERLEKAINEIDPIR